MHFGQFLVLEMEIGQMQIHRIQIHIQDEYNLSEILAKRCSILGSQASLCLLPAGQLRISTASICHFDYYIKRELDSINKLAFVNLG